MKPFSLSVCNSSHLSGIASIPERATTTPRFCPLIVAVHGGTYTSKYFDASPECSAGTWSEQLGVPFVAFDRPGYWESSALPSVLPEGSTFFQEEGKHLHKFILPKLWQEYGHRAGATTIVLVGHSMGVSSCIIAASLHPTDASAGYPLGGLILSGRCDTTAVKKSQGAEKVAEARRKGFLEFPPPVKDILMFGDSKLGLASPELRHISQKITHRGTVGEIEDLRLHWDKYWKQYAREIRVPVMAAIGEQDRLVRPSQQDLRSFTGAFTTSAKVEGVFISGAPHSLELSYWGPGWYARMFGFAIECATSATLSSKLQKL